MQTHRNTPAIVFDRNTAISMERDLDMLTIAPQRFIGGVVNDFLQDVQRVFRARVHAGSLFDRLQAFKYLDGGFGISDFIVCHTLFSLIWRTGHA